MAHSKQARKRTRQSDKNRVANRARMSVIKTGLKALSTAVKAGDKAAAMTLAVKACTTIDKAAKAHVIHMNKAARQKSQVMRAVNAMK
ncbi:30S ribosomal protein S20 [Planctomycetota bacterium]|jgi:small subunit ribosomal protein S20|nr:30S ribosomal protein S20 [Planctomycetota bacterium]MSR37779.1 30S ribosomal protein S20 [Planctomycetota bacterium]GDY02405.1 30S ribosomal protein S20 [Planctomycetota bacterium]